MLLAAHTLTGIVCMHIGFLITNNKGGFLRWDKIPKNSWLIIGLFLSFFSHAIIDVIGTMYTYHPKNTFESIFSTIFYFTLGIFAIIIIYFSLKQDKRYAYGIFFAMFFDIWDHVILKGLNCTFEGFYDGCTSINSGLFYKLQLHNFEWDILYSVFEGVERHNHQEIYVLVEIFFLIIMSFLTLKLMEKFPIKKQY
jgi:hypothetical protein